MLQIIKKEFFSCKLCDSTYTEENCPYSLSCGENLCKECKEKMIINNSPCPFDSSHKHTEKDGIPKNLAFKEIIEDITKLIELNKNKNKYDKELDDFINLLKQKKITEFQNGEINYKGRLKDNKPFGRGRLMHKKGIFEGIFFGEFHKGEGEINYTDNSLYKGKWENYKRQNKGVLLYPNLDKYEGEFKNDLFDGKGTLFINEKKIYYQGFWKEGKKEGLFNILNEKGEIIAIENYENDEKI